MAFRWCLARVASIFSESSLVFRSFLSPWEQTYPGDSLVCAH